MSKGEENHPIRKIKKPNREIEIIQADHWKIKVVKDNVVAIVDVDHINEKDTEYNGSVQVYWNSADFRQIAKMFNRIADEMDKGECS